MNAPAGRPQVFRFGVFELDTLAHELRKQGRRVRLQEQPYRILLMMRRALRHGRDPRRVTGAHCGRRAFTSISITGSTTRSRRLREALGDAATMPELHRNNPARRLSVHLSSRVSAATTAVQHVTNGSLPVQDAQLAVPAPAESALDPATARSGRMIFAARPCLAGQSSHHPRSHSDRGVAGVGRCLLARAAER